MTRSGSPSTISRASPLPVGARDGRDGRGATKRLRIGTAVSLAPFYNPLRLAEEVALLDVLSGGRVNWGAGRGFERSEFAAFGIPGEESAPRFHETVDIVLKAWTSQRLSYEGNHYRYNGVEVLPKPLQAPHPPVWMAALHSCDRVGGGPGPLDPDGPAFVHRRSRPKAAPLRREARGGRVFDEGTRPADGAPLWRSATVQGRGRRSPRGAAPNGSSIRIRRGPTTRSASRTRPRPELIRYNATSTGVILHGTV